jgi:hypothetical protein
MNTIAYVYYDDNEEVSITMKKKFNMHPES